MDDMGIISMGRSPTCIAFGGHRRPHDLDGRFAAWRIVPGHRGRRHGEVGGGGHQVRRDVGEVVVLHAVDGQHPVLALALETEKGRVIHAWFRKKPEKISTYNIRIIYIIHRYCYTIYVYDSHWGSHHSISMVEINVETMVEKNL